MKYTKGKRVNKEELEKYKFKLDGYTFERSISLYEDQEIKTLNINMDTGLIYIFQTKILSETSPDNIVIWDERLQGTITIKLVKKLYKLLTTKEDKIAV